jgi:hypothetical protein
MTAAKFSASGILVKMVKSSDAVTSDADGGHHAATWCPAHLGRALRASWPSRFNMLRLRRQPTSIYHLWTIVLPITIVNTMCITRRMLTWHSGKLPSELISVSPDDDHPRAWHPGSPALTLWPPSPDPRKSGGSGLQRGRPSRDGDTGTSRFDPALCP